MDQLDLSIIIVDYKSRELIINCLSSIKEYCHNFSYEIILVNNSLDADLSKLKEKVITPKENRGFGAGCNIGAQEASGEYLFFLNPDTFLVDNSIETMLQFTKNHTEIGALTCLLYQKNGKELQKNFFGRFQNLLSLTFRHYNYQKVNIKDEFFYADIVTGAALMIKRSLFRSLGGFDEKIFMYLEDDDLCKRLIDIGYKNAVLTTAKIVHLEGKSSNSKQRKIFYYNSQNYYWRKHYGAGKAFLMKAIRWPYKIMKTGRL